MHRLEIISAWSGNAFQLNAACTCSSLAIYDIMTSCIPTSRATSGYKSCITDVHLAILSICISSSTNHYLAVAIRASYTYVATLPDELY